MNKAFIVMCVAIVGWVVSGVVLNARIDQYQVANLALTGQVARQNKQLEADAVLIDKDSVQTGMYREINAWKAQGGKIGWGNYGDNLYYHVTWLNEKGLLTEEDFNALMSIADKDLRADLEKMYSGQKQ